MVSNPGVLLSYIVKIILFIIMELDKENIYTSIGNTSHIYRSFYFQSIQFWNKLISNIRIDGNFFLFKNKLKEYIVGMTVEKELFCICIYS